MERRRSEFGFLKPRCDYCCRASPPHLHPCAWSILPARGPPGAGWGPGDTASSGGSSLAGSAEPCPALGGAGPVLPGARQCQPGCDSPAPQPSGSRCLRSCLCPRGRAELRVPEPLRASQSLPAGCESRGSTAPPAPCQEREAEIPPAANVGQPRGTTPWGGDCQVPRVNPHNQQPGWLCGQEKAEYLTGKGQPPLRQRELALAMAGRGGTGPGRAGLGAGLGLSPA